MKKLEEQLSLIKRGVTELIHEVELKNKLEKKILKVKAGFDPTAPDLHLGHIVLLKKMQHFQKLGHEVTFLLGDFTATIGDPTGKSETRPQLSSKQISENMRTYEEQVFKILDKDKTKVRFNSEWCSNMNFSDVLKLTTTYNVARLLERDDFSKRYKSGQSISMIEFMYPLVQGYDSVALETDIELGGNDQKFNLLVGREIQKYYGQERQCILTMPLLVGLDGVKKMSKSLNNYVGIDEKPIDMYGKLMSISDDLMWHYFELLTDFPQSEIENKKVAIQKNEIHPKEVKSELAKGIISQFHSLIEVENSIEEWNRVHSTKNRVLPQDIPEKKIDSSFCEGNNNPQLVWILSKIGFFNSVSEGKRLIKAGAIYLNEQKVEDDKLTLSQGQTVTVRQGKKGKFIKIIF